MSDPGGERPKKNKGGAELLALMRLQARMIGFRSNVLQSVCHQRVGAAAGCDLLILILILI
ncbi:hypothetical protein AYO71_20305 [Pseudomonas koreensis]|nr:hypothetical protein AYO71_20305 [Pseudomonas koreensis]